MSNHKKKAGWATVTYDSDTIELIIMLMQWHEHRVKQMHQILEAAEDTNFVVQSKNGVPITLEGDILKGFKAGISIAEELFTPFPIEVSRVKDGSDE